MNLNARPVGVPGMSLYLNLGLKKENNGVSGVFKQLEEIEHRPAPFELTTVSDLWADDYISKQMLSYHLNGDNDIASRKFSFIDRSVEWMISTFDLHTGRSVIDFGCGPGLYTERLARSHAAVTGIDFSKSSIEHARNSARAQNLKIDYVLKNYLEFTSQRKYDLILMIYCDYCALSLPQRKKLLSIFKTILSDTGSILLDVHSFSHFDSMNEGVTYSVNPVNNFWSSAGNFCFQNTYKYDAEKISLDKYTIIEKNRTRTIYNWLQHFNEESTRNEFAESSLRIDKYLANVAGDVFDPSADEFAVVATVK
jgi:cyclopropane fatty-acyl-phospholipid synthase-like methyltransferase